jgi:hypothetical protein
MAFRPTFPEKEREVLARVDLHVEAHPGRREPLRVKAVHEADTALAPLALRLAKPRVEVRAEGVQRRTDWFGMHLHEIDVLGIARRHADQRGTRLDVGRALCLRPAQAAAG